MKLSPVTIKFAANVAIQVAQPQVCHANPAQDATDKKPSMCRKVSEAVKTHLGIDIAGSSQFDAIGQLRPLRPLPPNLKPLLPKIKHLLDSPHPLKSPNH